MPLWFSDTIETHKQFQTLSQLASDKFYIQNVANCCVAWNGNVFSTERLASRPYLSAESTQISTALTCKIYLGVWICFYAILVALWPIFVSHVSCDVTILKLNRLRLADSTALIIWQQTLCLHRLAFITSHACLESEDGCVHPWDTRSKFIRNIGNRPPDGVQWRKTAVLISLNECSSGTIQKLPIWS